MGEAARAAATPAAGTGGATPQADSIEAGVVALARRARAASRVVARATAEERTEAIHAMARALAAGTDAVLAANRRDLDAAAGAGLAPALVDRLRLDEARLGALVAALTAVAEQPDPVGEVTERWTRPNGLVVRRERVPLGVVAMIYESRPNVTADAAALCVRAGNAAILRGGREAFHSNLAIAEALRSGLAGTTLPVDAVQLVPVTDRAAVDVLLRQEGTIDLVIPRGGEGLIRAVTEKSRIPVLRHYKGVCHVYVHADADPDAAERIVVNAKAQRPGVCNAMETLLVDRAGAAALLPRLAAALRRAGVELRGCEETRALLGEDVAP
ncbi:MAG: glutamate-5-semialdehyde dehydrogenase, partial [Gemmatimonadetes bacterium]